MVFRRRADLGQSFHPAEKSPRKNLGVAALLLFAACSSNPPQPQPQNVAPSIQSAQSGSGLRLTSIGNNMNGRFSPDGKKILFVSRQRAAHAQSQLYELNLENFREKRITYHDGDCVEGSYSPDGRHLLYASTTDELKERPVLLQASKSQQLPTELYLSDLQGSQIERLTQHPGFQGEASWVGSQKILFVSDVGSRFEIDAMTIDNKKPETWSTDAKATLHLPTVDLSATRVAWIIEKAEAPLELGLKLKGKIQSLPLPFDAVQSLEWIQAPDKSLQLLISAKKKDEKFLRGWILDPEKKCAGVLFQEPGDLKNLRVAKGQEKLLYQFEANGTSQLFLRELPPFPTECEPLKAAVLRTSETRSPAAYLRGHPRIQSDSAE